MTDRELADMDRDLTARLHDADFRKAPPEYYDSNLHPLFANQVAEQRAALPRERKADERRFAPVPVRITAMGDLS